MKIMYLVRPLLDLLMAKEVGKIEGLAFVAKVLAFAALTNLAYFWVVSICFLLKRPTPEHYG